MSKEGDFDQEIMKIPKSSQSVGLTAESKLFEILNQSVIVLMGIFIFFNPFPHTTAIQEISFYLSVAIVLVLVVSKKTEFSLITPLSLPFKFFVFWAFIGIFFALNKKNTINDFYAHLIKYIICYYIIVNFTKR